MVNGKGRSMDSPTTPASPRPPVNSVVQAIAVLRHLGAAVEPEGVTAIARALGLSPSSCFNVLRTLVREDLVRFDPVAKRYALGLGTIDLARRALGRDSVVSAAQAPMARIAQEHDAAVGLWRLSAGEDRLILASLAESAAATRIHMVVGQRQPATAGATGRAMLAWQRLDDAAIASAYAAVRWQNAPGEAAFLHQVRDAEAKGWATDIGQINHGISTVAAVVADGGGAPRFVLSASIFTGRESEAGLDGIGAAVRDVTVQLAQAR